MRLKLRIILLLCLVLAAAVSVGEAWRILRVEKGRGVPEELYGSLVEQSRDAEYFLRDSGGYVAVYYSGKVREPVTVTGIEVSDLRKADRAMLELGIPAADGKELLELLEDLGS